MDTDMDLQVGMQVEQDMELDGDDEMDSDEEIEASEVEVSGTVEKGKEEQKEYPFSLAPAIYYPFRGFDDSDGECPPSDVECPREPQIGNPIYINGLTKIIKNVIAQQNIVRNNMMYLTKQRVDQLYAKSRQDMKALVTHDEEKKREPVRPESSRSRNPQNLPPEDPGAETGENHQPRPETVPWRYGDPELDDSQLSPREVIRKHLYSEISHLMNLCATELEHYDEHCAEILKKHREELEKMGGNMDNILKELGLLKSPVSPADSTMTSDRRGSESTTFSPTATSPPMWRTPTTMSPRGEGNGGSTHGVAETERGAEGDEEQETVVMR
ncbi:hypothetical protein HYFRA_00010638 [Hymenoscyphus fraxineus]|uniref:Uncharacterized protein n=1 Tax=Hymenoscyphus fraxineus TaxID=746836 RepID=A0A9N9L6S9_9HELO|nr:hypothetical protein HYFRA_00010638 [Hymenoscyphus fraxineus]